MARLPKKDPNTTGSPLATIAPIARLSVVDAVAERLQNEILAGRMAAGSRLPSERDLAVALGVNRLTLRAALARIEALGYIATRHGAGSMVTSWRERAGLDALPRLIGAVSPTDPMWRELVLELLEIRRVLAAEVVALAAERHTAEDLVELSAIAIAQRARVDDPIVYANGDVLFQRALVRAARNVGFELVLNSLARFPSEHPELVAKLYDRPGDSCAFYDALLAILQTRDANLARQTVRTALEAIDAEWVERHAPRVGAKKR